MFTRNSNQHANQSYLVAKRSVAVYNTANNHINTSGGAVLLADGQLGFFDASGFGATGANKLNKSLAAAGITVAAAPIVKIYQGNENSAAPWNQTMNGPLWNRPYEESMPIHADGYILATKQDYQAPKHNVWVIGKPTAASTGKIASVKNTEYQFRVGFRGQLAEEFYNTEEALFLNTSYTTPDYTALSTAVPVDELVQNLVYNVNRNSQAFAQNKTRSGSFPIVALAVDSTASAGTAISAITAGTFLPLVNTTTGVKGIYPTAEQVASIVAATTAAGFDVADTVLTVDLTTAGTVTGGVADAIFLVALDTNAAFKDYTLSRKNRLTLGLSRGFDYNAVAQTEGVKTFEGQGLGRVLDRQYRNTQGQRKYNLIHVTDPIIEFASPIDPTDTYTTYIIDHSFNRQSDIHHISANPCKEIVLIPTLTKGVVNGSTNSQETAFELFVNNWLTSASKPTIMNHSA
jgi:hypothetical protein